MKTDQLYESSRGHKIDGTKPNQTGNTLGEKQGKQTEDNGQGSSQQRTSSPKWGIEETKIKSNQETQAQIIDPT